MTTDHVHFLYIPLPSSKMLLLMVKFKISGFAFFMQLIVRYVKSLDLHSQISSKFV